MSGTVGSTGRECAGGELATKYRCASRLQKCAVADRRGEGYFAEPPLRITLRERPRSAALPVLLVEEGRHPRPNVVPDTADFIDRAAFRIG